MLFAVSAAPRERPVSDVTRTVMLPFPASRLSTVALHVMPEMLVHMVAACPNGLTVEYMPWMLALYEETPAIENGQLVLPTKPGLGLKFDEKAIASFKA